MNGNRGQYTSAPLNNMKNRQRQAARPQGDAHQPSQQRFGWLALVLSLVLPILFLLALLIPSSVLRWIFLAGVGAAVAAMWLMNAFVRNARSTLTLVYLALAVVIG
ncbi:MAG: hypothetical protein E7324_08825, partial [Clostridiales bacterium]|nr:hypothetical protein [Clostridiales bacterium]